MSRRSLKHCHIEIDDERIAWLTLDVSDAGANTLSNEVLQELDAAFERFEEERPQGVVIQSGKPGFIAGANVPELGGLKSSDEARDLVQRGQDLMDRIERFGNTVALIRGHCLGGGLELALACRYRICDRDPGTRLGLPEVKLGIHPGFGGSVRMPDRVGALSALDLMLSGRTIDGRAARGIGLVDQALPPWQLPRAARHYVLNDPGPSRPAWWKRALSLGPARRLLRPLMLRQLRGRVRREHYPAPYNLLDLWVAHGGESAARRTRHERESLIRLVEGPTAANLIRVFLLQDRLKREARDTALEVPRRVHVVGAGTMGGDIAAWFVLNGCRVTLADESPDAIASTLKRARALFERRLKRPERVTEAMDRLIPDARGHGVPRADVVLEAIVENLDAKKSLFAELEPRMGENAVLATNTSSLPLEQLAEDLDTPEHLIGLHFFNPVARMPLVEIVAGENSGAESLARGQALIAACDKLPLPVRSGPGFLVNRLLMPYMLLSARRFTEGTDRESIDEAACRFGMPMGPLELMDSVGLDICVAAADVMAEAQGLEIPEQLRKKVEAGNLGRKSGRGFYAYEKGKPDRGEPTLPPEELDRLGAELLEPLLDEAKKCRDEKVVADADLVDAGAIFGCGFAPFTGGPLHYREQRQSEN